jgi:hypothetical protein
MNTAVVMDPGFRRDDDYPRRAILVFVEGTRRLLVRGADSSEHAPRA